MAKKRTARYWADRATEREKQYRAESEETLKTVQAAYEQAIKNIEREAKSVVKNLALRGGEEAPDAEAYYARLERLAAVKRSIDKEIGKVREVELKADSELFKRIMGEGYYRTVFDIQKGIGAAYEFALLPKLAVALAMRENWSGGNFSERIWKNAQKIGESAAEVVTGGLLSGASTYTMRDQLMERMSEELAEVGDRAAYMATRLIRTETNYFANQGELLAYQDAGIEWYEYMAVLDARTSEVCFDLDGKRFKLSEAEPGKNYPPMHAFCRSTTTALIDGEATDKLEKRARDPATGKVFTVPEGTTYAQWQNMVNPEGVAGRERTKTEFFARMRERADSEQYKKYRSIFGGEAGETLEDFIRMKYNDDERWQSLKQRKQGALNVMEYRPEFDGMFGDREVRGWYIDRVSNIPQQLDPTKPLVERAQMAFQLRRMYKLQARNMMADLQKVDKLNQERPSQTFEQLLRHKKEKYGLEDDDALIDIIRSASTPNKNVNAELGFD